MPPETECPGLHSRYTKTDDYFRDFLLISHRKAPLILSLSLSATWVLQPDSEINYNGTVKNCYCQRILPGKCWHIPTMGCSTAETDGQTNHPDLNVAGGHGLLTCNSGLIHPILLWSMGTAQHTSSVIIGMRGASALEKNPWKKHFSHRFCSFTQNEKSLPWVFPWEKNRVFYKDQQVE